MEIYKIEKENNRIVITIPYYNEKGEEEGVEKMYYRKIGGHTYRFSKNEIEENNEKYENKELTGFFFDQCGDLVEEVEEK